MKAITSRRRRLTEDQLLVKFQRECRYDETATQGHKYRIRVGRNFLYSDDTRDLFEKYMQKVQPQ